MAQLEFTVTAVGTGPFTYTIASVDPCADITFTNPATGDTGVNSLVVSSVNKNLQLTAEFDEDDCSTDEALATIQVTGTNSEGCTDIAELTVDNPCYEFTANIQSFSMNDGIQTLLAQPQGGVGPMSYEWVITGVSGSSISGPDDNQTVNLYRRTDTIGTTVSVTVTDGNGCTAEASIYLPVPGQPPVTESGQYIADCATQYDDVVWDLRDYTTDPDDGIDYSTFTIHIAAAEGTVTQSDTEPWLITYTPDDMMVVDDQFFWRIQDNSGNWSNVSVFQMQFQDCLDPATATNDTASTNCNTAVDIDVFANDVQGDGLTEEDSISIIHGPTNGTAIYIGSGTVRYTPEAEFDGEDAFWYTITDTDGRVSDPARVTVTVNPCCDNHTAALSFACVEAGDDITVTPTQEGTVPGEDTVTLEYRVTEAEVAGAWTAASDVTYTRGCSPGSTYYINDGDGYTNASGIWSSGADGTCTISVLGASLFEIEIEFGDPIPQGQADEMQAEFDALTAEVLYLNTDSGTEPDRFIVDNISNYVVTTDGITFNYETSAASGVCSADIDTYVTDTHNYLDGLGDLITEVANYEITLVEYRAFGVEVIIEWRLTITRSNGCDDIVLIYQWTLDSNDENACDNMNFILDEDNSSEVGEGEPYLKTNWYLNVDDSAATEVTDFTIDSSNILTRSYDLYDEDEIQALEDDVNTWLAANDEGGVDIYWDGATRLIIYGYDIGASTTFNNIVTDNATTNFTELS